MFFKEPDIDEVKTRAQAQSHQEDMNFQAIQNINKKMDRIIELLGRLVRKEIDDGDISV